MKNSKNKNKIKSIFNLFYQINNKMCYFNMPKKYYKSCLTIQKTNYKSCLYMKI